MGQTEKYQFHLFFQLIVVLASIFGSLFFSEVMKFPPCNLCWYQRICVYPMSLIILTGLYLKSKDTIYFLIPLSFCGLALSLYHNLVYYKFITVIVPCSETAPCTAQHLNWLGFITIPLLSLLTFLILFISNLKTLLLLKKIRKSDEK